ncbi:proline iminopeptidase [Thermosporothrix hazakensis]|jgi:proline iminopeptidase|uniref:Proline iminopeptidase n=1 Tax=Thermosporothrix hazakensis TaxID=644383 RepID=A0A326U4L1_THEHA|nr:alpha/beta hydrolase [Thermosporothrix hazakensis]PZW27988.1 proline iminopeptidase [Thermosporothrix hazakensis]GCE51211.1 AB hydrolase superfamily protein YclE [Thermosporothrix hazakensis]
MERQGTLSVGGFTLTYRIEGEGTPLLVVGSALYYSRLFAPALRKKVQLIFIDHRGFGVAPASYGPEDYRFERVVDDIEEARQQLGLGDVVIVGHSGHAFLALEYAQKYPEAARRVVLLNSAPTNSPARQEQSVAYFVETAEPERKERFERDFALFQRDVQRDPEHRFVHLLIRTRAQAFYDYHFDTAPLWEGVHPNMPIIDYLWGNAFASIDMKQHLLHFDRPVLLCLGRYDYLIGPVALWDGIEAANKHVRKVIFERSGHNPMYEEPDRFEQTLLDWLHSS